MLNTPSRLGYALTVLTVLLCPIPIEAKVLITAAEAQLPEDPFNERAPFPGPKLILEMPALVRNSTQSPVHLKIRFESRGAKIDVNSLNVTYRKLPAVDLTDRVKEFVSPNGIDMKDAEVPLGRHKIAVDIKDIDGLQGRVEFTLDVQK
jgi:hypothetical protein